VGAEWQREEGRDPNSGGLWTKRRPAARLGRQVQGDGGATGAERSEGRAVAEMPLELLDVFAESTVESQEPRDHPICGVYRDGVEAEKLGGGLGQGRGVTWGPINSIREPTKRSRRSAS
jgi:hypothetical protein